MFFVLRRKLDRAYLGSPTYKEKCVNYVTQLEAARLFSIQLVVELHETASGYTTTGALQVVQTHDTIPKDLPGVWELVPVTVHLV